MSIIQSFFLATSLNNRVLLFWETCQVSFERIVVLTAESGGLVPCANQRSAKIIRRRRQDLHPAQEKRAGA